MNELIWVLDYTIAISVLFFAANALFTRNTLNAIIQFIFLGTSISLIWVRLDAIDVALAEVAIGSALTGALFFSAVANTKNKQSTITINMPVISIFFVLILGGIFLVAQSPKSLGLLEHLLPKIPESGVLNPITAVLLNFRAYDTLLEITVLFAAAFAVAIVSDLNNPKQVTSPTRDQSWLSPVATVFRLSLLPVGILISGYILWVGYKAPGGAFQSGALLAGLFIMLNWLNPKIKRNWTIAKPLLIIGPALFIIIAIVLEIISGQALDYPVAQAKSLILIIEVTSTVSIATALSVLYLGLKQLGGNHAKR